jgi:hypothetical protein
MYYIVINTLKGLANRNVFCGPVCSNPSLAMDTWQRLILGSRSGCAGAGLIKRRLLLLFLIFNYYCFSLIIKE